MNIVDRIAAAKAQLSPRNGGFECPNGWQELIATTHEAIMQIDPNYQIEQVKEKFGGLRFYYSPTPTLPAHLKAEIASIASRAETKSFSICQACGQPGEQVENTMAVRCELHRHMKRRW